MKLTAKVKLQTTPEQHQALIETLETANAACNQISEVAWNNHVFNQFRLHGLTYRDIRDTTDLTAQIVVRCISKVTDAYKLDKKTKRIFKPLGAIAYDARILRWYVPKQEVSIWTVDGRLRIPFLAGQPQLELLKHQHGESDLVYIKGNFYLFATCEIEDPEKIDPIDVLGIDLGIVNIATDSDGNKYSGSQVLSIRKRRQRQRRRLQTKQTKSATRLLKKLSKKEHRFSKNVNHVISKQVVNLAQHTNRAIALENLQGIRFRVRVRKQQRSDLHSWAFNDLRQKIEYKAKLSGIPVVAVGPRNTSRMCSVCGYIDKANRKSQSSFLCKSCGHADSADANAAKNIAFLGWPVVNQAYGSSP